MPSALRQVKQKVKSNLGPFNQLSRLALGRRTTPVMDCDWDTLLVLDACRYDLFEKHNVLPGTLERRWSMGSSTPEFLNRNFVGRTFPDTVLVTATPKYTAKGVQDNFYAIEQVWQDHWDDDLRTLPPETMNDLVGDARERYPDKRVIGHYVQPHTPFIGPTGRDLPHKVQFAGETIRHGEDLPNIWDALDDGTIDSDRAWQAYEENVQLVIDALDGFVQELPGKTAVTADHGNVFGTYGIYGHPGNIHIRELIEVPWLIHDSKPRLDIVSGDIDEQRDTADDDVVSDRLADLGYLE